MPLRGISIGKRRTRNISLEGFGSFLGRDKGCLIVRDKERNVKRYPLFDNELNQIQIRSGNMVSSGALATCAFWNIEVLILTGRGAPVAVLKSFDDDSHVATRVAQYRSLDDGKFEGLAKSFVLGKIEGQNQVLMKYELKSIDESIVEKVKKLKLDETTRFRSRLNGLEGKASQRYFDEIFTLFKESYRPRSRKSYKAYDGLNNLLNLGYKVVMWKIHIALIKAKLEPYLGYLHGLQHGKPSLVCDFLELYRYFVDDFVIGFTDRVNARDFLIHEEDYSSKKKGKRQYLNEKLTNEFLSEINLYFKRKVDVPLIRFGKRQKIETLIDEEALRLAKYLRDEIKDWTPRVASLI